MEVYDSSQLFKKAMERLNERYKELSCLYQVLEILRDDLASLDTIFYAILEKIPPGWQYPSVCEACITYEGKKYRTPGFKDTQWKQHADLVVDNGYVGKIEIIYTQLIREVSGSQFLPEEQKLLNSIADRISDHIFFRRLRSSIKALEVKAEKRNHMIDPILSPDSDEHWKWRMHMAELIASRIDAPYYGVKAFYVIGSTKNHTSGPGSDIDLILHIEPYPQKQCELTSWLKGWSICLAEINYTRTGYHSEGLLDVHYITDQDIKDKTSYAVMLHNPDNRAKPLAIKHTS
ncbi:MAG: hypothetical protein AB9842_14120 [Bacteroidales bacterium]